jgi:hypothetical protein
MTKLQNNDFVAQSLTHAETGTECAQCHGVGTRWVNEHINWDLPTKSGENELAEKAGYQPLKKIEQRVALCLSCHVGGPGNVKSEYAGLQEGRIVNHDLIAAGHPRLHFEYLAYYQAMGKHWNHQHAEDTDQVEIWHKSQLAGLKAKVKLLVHHTSQSINAGDPKNANDPKYAEKHPVWPELTELSCFSCHQEYLMVLEGEGKDREPNKRHVYHPTIWGNEFAEMFTLTAEVLKTSTDDSDSRQLFYELVNEVKLINERLQITSLTDQVAIHELAVKMVEKLELLEQREFNKSWNEVQQVSFAKGIITAILQHFKEDVQAEKLQWEQIVSRVQALMVMTKYLAQRDAGWQPCCEESGILKTLLDFPKDERRKYVARSPINQPLQKSQVMNSIEAVRKKIPAEGH